MRFSCSNSALLARHQHLQLQQLQQQQLQICSGSVDIFGKKYEKNQDASLIIIQNYTMF